MANVESASLSQTHIKDVILPLKCPFVTVIVPQLVYNFLIIVTVKKIQFVLVVEKLVSVLPYAAIQMLKEIYFSNTLITN